MDTIKEKLCKPFKEDEHEWRVQQMGWQSNGEPWVMVLAYVQARPIQERLDEIFGVLGWKDEYRITSGGIICRLSVYDNKHKEWIAKENGSPETDIEAFKGGISKAFVRVAASGYGIGRYLYNLETTFAHASAVEEKGWNKGRCKKTNKSYWWQTPQLPKWAYTTKAKQPPKGKKDEDKTEDKDKTDETSDRKHLIREIVNDCMILSDHDPEKAKLILEKYTSFQGKDGNIVKGTKETSALQNYSDKRLQTTHGILKKAREEFQGYKDQEIEEPAPPDDIPF